MPWDDSRTLCKPQYSFVNLGKSRSVEKYKTTKRLLFNSFKISFYALSLIGLERTCVDSKDDLVKTKFGEYGEMQKGWTAEDAKGFIKVTSTPLRVYYTNHKDEEL